MLTILYSFKNKDLTRVKNSIDSLVRQNNNEFEVLFIDFGSDEQYKNGLIELCKRYDFVRCIYIHSKGALWSKPIALNVGLKNIESEYVLVSDIDMIYDPNFIDTVYDNVHADIVTHFKVGYLHENQNVREFDFSKPKVDYYSNIYATGICAFPLKKAMEIRGYDEFFKLWGVEDNDFIRRLKNNGLTSVFYDSEILVYHQFHPVFLRKRKKAPDYYIEDFQRELTKKALYNNRTSYKVNQFGFGRRQTEKEYDTLAKCTHVVELSNYKKDIDIYIDYFLSNTTKPTKFVFKIKELSLKEKIKKFFLKKYFMWRKFHYSFYELNQILLKKIIFDLSKKKYYTYFIKEKSIEITLLPIDFSED